MVSTLFMSRHGPASSTGCYLCCCQPVHVSVLSFGCLDGLGHSALRVWLPSVFHDHRWLMLVPYILALAIFVSRHEVVRYLTDSSNPVTALSSHHYSVKISMYEKAELIKSYRIVPFHLLSSHFLWCTPLFLCPPSFVLLSLWFTFPIMFLGLCFPVCVVVLSRIQIFKLFLRQFG